MSKADRERDTRWEFKETSQFQKARAEYLSDVEFEALREVILRHPEQWVLLKGAPGLFGLHWGRPSPKTIVFMIAPDIQRVYLLDIERGRHSSVEQVVKDQLPRLLDLLREHGAYIIKAIVDWLKD